MYFIPPQAVPPMRRPPTKTRPGPSSRLTSDRWRLLGAGRRVECAKLRKSTKTVLKRIWLGHACAVRGPDTSCAGLHGKKEIVRRPAHRGLTPAKAEVVCFSGRCGLNWGKETWIERRFFGAALLQLRRLIFVAILVKLAAPKSSAEPRK